VKGHSHGIATEVRPLKTVKMTLNAARAAVSSQLQVESVKYAGICTDHREDNFHLQIFCISVVLEVVLLRYAGHHAVSMSFGYMLVSYTQRNCDTP